MKSFTSGDANKVVRNVGEGRGLESWRRLHAEYDPTSSMCRVAILGMVQNPPRCEKIEELGKALSDWLERKRQYEDFTDEKGEPCRVSSDSLMAAMYKIMPKALEEAVMFKSDEFESFDALFDRLLAYSGTRHSMTMKDVAQKRNASSPDDMDIGAFGNQGKGADRKANVQCWVCFGYGHYGKECPRNAKGKGNDDSKGQGKTYEIKG